MNTNGMGERLSQEAESLPGPGFGFNEVVERGRRRVRWVWAARTSAAVVVIALAFSGVLLTRDRADEIVASNDPGSATAETSVSPSTSVGSGGSSSTVVDQVVLADALGQLESVVDRLIESDGAFVSASVDVSRGTAGDVLTGGSFYVTYPVSDVSVLWAPTARAADAAAELDTVRVRLNEEREAWLEQNVGAGNVVLMVDPDGTDSALISPVATDRVASSDLETGALSLSAIMRALTETPLTVVDYCEPGARQVSSATETGAVVEHIAALLASRIDAAQRTEYEQTVDQLVGPLAFEDAVTGLTVEPDANDLMRQLEAGVAVEDLVVRQVVPIAIDLTEYDGADGFAFFESETGEYLGFMALGRAEETFLAEVRAPSDGSGIQIRFSTEAPGVCDELPDDRITLITIDYPDAAGDQHRALVNVAKRETSALDRDQFLSLANDN